MNKNNPLNLTISLTDPALNLTIKREITFNPQDRPSETAARTADAIEEAHSLLATAQHLLNAIPCPDPPIKAPSSPPHCDRCGKVVKSYADTYLVHPYEVCHCPDPI